MRAGRLRQRVTIQSRTETRDADGGVATTWTDFATAVPAEVMSVSGREFLTAEAVQSEVRAKITIRYLSGVLPNMRVVFSGLNYNISAVLPDPTTHRHLMLVVGEGLNDG